MEVTDDYQSLSERIDMIVHEVVKVGRTQEAMTRQLEVISENMNDVELVNGGGRIVIQPKQQLFQIIYDFTKYGGVFDKRIEEVEMRLQKQNREIEDKLLNQIANCKLYHDPEKENERRYKKADRIMRYSAFIGAIIVGLFTFIWGVIKIVDWKKALE